MNMKWVRMHHDLLRLMLEMGLSKSLKLRIIDAVNELLDDPEACMARTEQIINLLQACKTEEEVIQKLDDAGL